MATSQTLSKLVIVAVLTASGCASVDFDYPKPETHVLADTGSTHLGRQIEPLVAAHPGKSAFYLLTDGIEALAARLLLAQRAEKTLDVQYYLITDDTIGILFIASLLDAADRGVRVRLLLDDIQTQGYDAGMAALDSHPNFEVRIWNPFASRNARFMDGLTSFSRINRRMHNKSFTADNQITILGGRNIADEYFAFNNEVNFGDVDVLGAGRFVSEVSNMFDTYWNDIHAAPIPAFADMPDDPQAELERIRGKIKDIRAHIADTRYSQALQADVHSLIDGDDREFAWAPFELAYDSPEKTNKAAAKDAENITAKLAATVELADKELIVISPYFVPRKKGVEYIKGLIDKGLNVTIITNSLAANNHGIVHSGYAASRKSLLQMGVKIYEAKVRGEVGGVSRGGSGAELATLHTKAFLVDRKYLFIGSFNWDPRSVNINTESGVIIESAALGEVSGKLIDVGMKERFYRVVLNRSGKLRWVDQSGKEMVIYDKEPDTTWWRRAKASMGRILPVRGQL
jgi:putative cardiolipin synthase